MNLSELGWDSFFDSHFAQYAAEGYSAMRVIYENRGKYVSLNDIGKFKCEVSGKFQFEAVNKSSFPAVGDWVAASVVANEEKAIINAVLPRKSFFSRKVVGERTEEQVIASNIDTIFIVTGLDLNFNLRRIERYLSVAWNSGAVPVILLNKSDTCEDAEVKRNEVEEIAFGVEVHNISAHTGWGLDNLYKYLNNGKTAAFIGSSGVGKSSIINAILGADLLKTSEVSGLGSRGKHATTWRELIILPNGGIVIDTPGMRELQIWGNDDGLQNAFSDIEQLALNCKFRDCRHDKEPACTVKEALRNGSLEQKRFESYLKLKKEYEYLAERQSNTASAVEKKRWKEISKYAKMLKKNK
jgi:ribosome biogenesis GTPase / thiamine phosphate phosphatase